MEKLVVIILLIGVFNSSFGQKDTGKVIYRKLYAKSLKNDAGENPERHITIYLPPGYEESSMNYPAIYYLPGFGGVDSLLITRQKVNQLLDRAINKGILKSTIVVIPNQYTLYKSSMYTNSTYTGNWADFTAKDLVDFIDSNFRTIINSKSRGIAGHSMGGYGAIKIAMQFPEVFSVVYGLSPGNLDIYEADYLYAAETLKQIPKIETREQLLREILPNVYIAMGRAFSPNPDKPPFYADLPYEYVNDKLIPNQDVLALWKKHSLINMIDSHVDSLLKLRAIKFDWGRNDQFAYIPISCMAFSRKLELYGINHYAEEYLGTHSNMLWTEDGRAMTDMFPFFNQYLEYE